MKLFVNRPKQQKVEESGRRKMLYVEKAARAENAMKGGGGLRHGQGFRKDEV